MMVKKIRMMVRIWFFLLLMPPLLHAIDLDIVKYTLIGARDLIPDMQVSYTCLYCLGPNPNRAADQLECALTSLTRKYLKTPLPKYDRYIKKIIENEINPDGSTQQEYSMTSFLSGEKLKTTRRTDYGPISLFGQYCMLITDGQNCCDGIFLGSDEIAEDRFIWLFCDPIRDNSVSSSMGYFDGSMFPPSFFGYKPGEMLKENRWVKSIVFYEDTPEIAYVKLHDRGGQVTGFFEIDTTKGCIASRGTFFLTPHGVNTYTFIQYELHDIQEVSTGFYFPRSATILYRNQNVSQTLPDGFIENPQPTEIDQIIKVTMDSVEIVENGIPADEFIAPVKAGDQIDDHRSSVLARASEGFFPHDLYFEPYILELIKKYQLKEGSVTGLSGGIAGPEYDYLKLP